MHENEIYYIIMTNKLHDTQYSVTCHISHYQL